MLDHIYAQEITDGLSDKLALASISYASEIQPASAVIPDISNNKSLAEYISRFPHEDAVLFPFTSILASCGYNKNLDIFDPKELWNARATPVNKPVNLEHNEKVIIGVTAASDVVDLDYKPIVATEAPEKFHALARSFIYKHWSDEVFMSEIQKVIAEIADWFVSMECLFRGFDYGIMSPNGDQKVIARDETTAFLTKHLRQYGGTGSYEGHTIGRVLRNITFSGMGLVRRPANPDSIIFSANSNLQNFNGTSAPVVYLTSNVIEVTNSTEISNMTLEEKVARLEAELATANQKLVDTSISSVQVKLDAANAEISKLTKIVAEKDDEIKKEKKDKEKVEAEKKDFEDKFKKAEDDKSKAEKAKDEYEKEAKKMYKEKATEVRVAKLVQANVPEKEIPKCIANFESYTDDQFDAFVVLLANQFGDVDVTKPDPEPETGPVKHTTQKEFIIEMINKYKKQSGPQTTITQIGTASAALDTAVASADTNQPTETSAAAEIEETIASVSDYLQKNSYFKTLGSALPTKKS